MNKNPRALIKEALLLASLPFLVNIFNGVQAVASEGIAFKVGFLATICLAAIWVLVYINDSFRYESKRVYKRTDNYSRLIVSGLVLQICFVLAACSRGLFNGTTDFYPFVGQIVGLGLCLGVPLGFGLYRSGTLTPDAILGRAFMLAVIVFCCVNFSMYILGFHSASFVDVGEGGVRNRTLELIGISLPRTTFPLSSGQNGFAVFAAAAGIFCACGLFYAKNRFDRVLGFLGFGLCLFGVVMTDSRGAIFALFVCGLVLLLVKSFKMLGFKWLYVIVAILFFSPVIILMLEPIIVQTPLFDLLDRGEFSDPLAAITTGRSYIWLAVWHYISANPETMLFGLGQYGHVISKASQEYAFVFGVGGAGLVKSTHNTMLQLLIDQGILGALILIVLVFSVVSGAQSILTASPKEASGSEQWYGYGASLIVLCLVICAQSEIVMTPYLPDTLFLLYFAACLVIGKPRIPKK